MMSSRRQWLVTAAALGGGGTASAASRLEALLARPPASGLLVVQMVRDSPAAKRGLREGDLLQSYAGTRLESLSQLLQLIDDHERAGRQLDVVFQRDGKGHTLKVDPGLLGVRTVRVEAGKTKWKPREEERWVSDVGGLSGESWLSYRIGGRRAGFERIRLNSTRDAMTSEHRVAFVQGDYEARFEVKIQMHLSGPVAFKSLRFTSGVKQDFLVEAQRQQDRISGTRKGASEQLTVRGTPVVPSYAIALLAKTVPLKEGFFTAFAVFEEADFRLQPGHELVCVKRERIEVQGRSTETWVFEDRHYSEPGNRYWIDSKRRLVRATYGRHQAVLGNREEILRTLPSRLVDFSK